MIFLIIKSSYLFSKKRQQLEEYKQLIAEICDKKLEQYYERISK